LQIDMAVGGDWRNPGDRPPFRPALSPLRASTSGPRLRADLQTQGNAGWWLAIAPGAVGWMLERRAGQAHRQHPRRQNRV